MKIQGTNQNLFMLQQKSEFEKEQENTKQKNLPEASVQVTISEKGYDCYRDNLTKMEGYIQQKQPDKDYYEALVNSTFGDVKKNIKNELLGLGQEIMHSKGIEDNAEQIASSFFEAYALLYDQIQSNDKEKYVFLDNGKSGKEGFRTLTKEEEQQALDAAYESIMDGMKKYVEATPEREKMAEIIEREHRKVEEILRRKQQDRKKMANEEEAQKPAIEPEKLMHNMHEARLGFKRLYVGFMNKSDVLNGISDLITEFFNRKEKNELP